MSDVPHYILESMSPETKKAMAHKAYSSTPIKFKRKKAKRLDLNERLTRQMRDIRNIYNIPDARLKRTEKGWEFITDKKLNDGLKHDLKWELMLPDLIFVVREKK